MKKQDDFKSLQQSQYMSSRKLMDMKLWTFLSILSIYFQVTSSCEIVDVTASNVTSASLNLSWKTVGACFIKEYTVEYTLQKYMACPLLTTASKPKDVSTKTLSTVINGLEAYSAYKFIVIGLDNGGHRIKTAFEASTKADIPLSRPLNPTASELTQAIHYTWEQPPLLSDEAVCQQQRGQMDGFFIQLFSLDSWAASALILNDTMPENVAIYYAQHLVPFTSYKLKVFIKNQDGLYNPNRPLEINAKTMSYIPRTPQMAAATATSSSSVHLRWQPSFPPTGIIEKYIVRYGPKAAEVMDWKGQLEVANSTNYCSKMSQQNHFVCVAMHNLEANTTYVFQVQTYNVNISQPSNFSTSFEATTDPPEIPPPTSKSTTSSTSRPHSQGGPYDKVSSHIVIIIVSLFIIVVLVIVVASLIYKIKMNKLKTIYEARGRQQFNGLQSPPRSLSVSALGGYYPNESFVNTSMSTVNYMVEEIQRRRLPELPKAASAESEYQNPDEDYVNTNRSPDLLANVTALTTATTSIPTEDNCTDIDGYLRPTFPERPPAREAVNDNNSNFTTVIPTESYVSAVRFEHFLPPRTISPTISTTTESHPLISLTSIK
jgi:hypothetical protein